MEQKNIETTDTLTAEQPPSEKEETGSSNARPGENAATQKEAAAPEQASETKEAGNTGAEADETSARNQAYDEIRTEILEHFRSFSPAEHISSQITTEHITEYLEGLNEEKIQQYRERREKRILRFFEIIAVLAAIVLVVKFLGNNPALLTSVIYIIGGLLALYIWKKPRKKDDKNE